MVEKKIDIGVARIIEPSQVFQIRLDIGGEPHDLIIAGNGDGDDAESFTGLTLIEALYPAWNRDHTVRKMQNAPDEARHARNPARFRQGFDEIQIVDPVPGLRKFFEWRKKRGVSRTILTDKAQIVDAEQVFAVEVFVDGERHELVVASLIDRNGWANLKGFIFMDALLPGWNAYLVFSQVLRAARAAPRRRGFADIWKTMSYRDIHDMMRLPGDEAHMRQKKAAVPKIDWAYQDAEDDRLLAYVYAQDDYRRFATAEERIRREFGLFTLYGGGEVSAGTRQNRLIALARRPELAVVLIFHGDGRIREAALQMLEGPLDHPVIVYGLVSRLNDWSPQVRDAAVEAFERCFSATPVEILLPAVWSLLLNTRDWRRWWYEPYKKRPETLGFERAVLQNRTLTEGLIDWIAQDQHRGAGLIFRFLCRNPHLDGLLAKLVFTAHPPHIRTIALNCLVSGRVRWSLGTRTRRRVNIWNDHVRMEPDFGERAISVEYDLVEILDRALDDRATMVRREAFDAVILHRQDPRFQPLVAKCLDDLAKDPAPGIRLRLDYLKRKIAEAT